MEDRVVVYQDAVGQWRWNRVAGNYKIIADSSEGYVHIDDCREMAVRVNAQPYILEVAGGVVVDIDTSQRVVADES